jgi:Na+-transporting NADH:ubiquinone oxidoreductase subunit C
MQKDDINTIRFAAIICLVCSMALAGVQGALRSTQERNKRIDEQINVLKALSPNFDPQGEALSDEDQEKYFLLGRVPKDWIPIYFEGFVEQNEIEIEEGDTRILYQLKNKEGEIVSYAFPAEGKGLWSTVHSYVGLQPDLATIRGITFFDHGETPGLGGECSKPWFQGNFQGKKLWDNGEPVRFEVAKGSADPQTDYKVDGMSGATITGNGIQRFLNETFREYNAAVFERKRAM